jgi:hypothetical protein
MKKPAIKDQPHKKRDPEKRDAQLRAGSKGEYNKSNFFEEKTEENASQAGFSDPGSGERASPIDLKEWTVEIP